MIHEVKILWHDLIENPKDLPKENGSYWCVVKNRYTDEVCWFSYLPEYEYGYNSKYRVWSFSWDDGYGAYGGSGCYESIGIERNLDIPEEEDEWMYGLITEDFSDEFVVIAWAEIPEDWPRRKEIEQNGKR